MDQTYVSIDLELVDSADQGRDIHSLDPDTLAHIVRLSEPLDWPLRPLFAKALSTPHTFGDHSVPALIQVATAAPMDRSAPKLVPDENITPLDVDELERALSAGGELAAQLDGFEQRAEQVAMLRAVAEAFNDSETLLVEAGTGTGKSLAYLLPAVRFAMANNRRVIVSTNTINLQDQLSQKELPTLRRLVGPEFRFNLLKGRTNYLCLRRWEGLLRSDDLAPEERTLLIKTLLWLPGTASGDRAELRLAGREEAAWLKVCALAEACSPQRCVYHRTGVCFLARARRSAESSHLVVVNHSLLLADLATGSRVLPEYRHLIIDEAHHLEAEATSQLGWRIGPRELLNQLVAVWDSSGGRPAGLAPRALGLLARPGSQMDRSALGRIRDEVVSAVRAVADNLPPVFDLLGRFLTDHGQAGEAGAASVRLTGAARTQPAWSDVEIAWDNQNGRLLRLLRALGELTEALESVVDHDEAWEELSAELAVQVAFWQTWRDRLWSVLAEPSAETIAWLTIARDDHVYLNAAPLSVGQHLREGLFANKDCVVLTSATLAAAGSFRYIRERLGLEEARELLLGSPFEYPRAALVYLPSDVPEPTSPSYQPAVEALLGDLIGALEGRTLVLFTSYSQLRATHRALYEPLVAQGIDLLAQGVDGSSRAHLLDGFKARGRVALFGTASFWEGVDVVGEALSCLVIARLPFTSPGDPIFQARGEMFEQPFNQYAVPQAVLRFRQGFGRLIRSRSDRGVLLVLDRRLKTRYYGRAFLQSLPDCTFREGPAAQAASAAREWLSVTPDARVGAAVADATLSYEG